MLSTHFSSRSVHGGHGLKETKHIPPQVLLTGLKVWARRLKIQKAPFSKNTLYWAGSSDIFYFPSFSKGGGWGSQRGNSSKIRGKRGTKGGGEEG